MKTLILSGLLQDDGTLRLHIPFSADQPPQAGPEATGKDAVEVELLDDGGAVLSSARIDGAPVCSAPTGPGAQRPPQRLIAGAVAMPEGTTGLRLRFRGLVIHEAHATAGEPTVKLTWHPPADGVVSGRQLVTWDSSHPDGAPMHFLVLAQLADGTRVATASVQGNQADLDARFLPEGTVSLVLIASDGFHQTRAESLPFTLARGGQGGVQPHP